MDYTIVSGSQVKEVIKEVKALIADGWYPIGGVTSNSFFYNQAMVKAAIFEIVTQEDTVDELKNTWVTPPGLEALGEKGITPANGVTNIPAKRSHKKKKPE